MRRYLFGFMVLMGFLIAAAFSRRPVRELEPARSGNRR